MQDRKEAARRHSISDGFSVFEPLKHAIESESRDLISRSSSKNSLLSQLRAARRRVIDGKDGWTRPEKSNEISGSKMKIPQAPLKGRLRGA